ncbi:MAG: hypothetical protein J3K34DRAFT_445210 [Monoraphidium minutum]|nr:MAG: hypothetical protein J3K34DRAFT_445210 [Monoraphidium minutum]
MPPKDAPKAPRKPSTSWSYALSLLPFQSLHHYLEAFDKGMIKGDEVMARARRRLNRNRDAVVDPGCSAWGAGRGAPPEYTVIECDHKVTNARAHMSKFYRGVRDSVAKVRPRTSVRDLDLFSEVGFLGLARAPHRAPRRAPAAADAAAADAPRPPHCGGHVGLGCHSVCSHSLRSSHYQTTLQETDGRTGDPDRWGPVREATDADFDTALAEANDEIRAFDAVFKIHPSYGRALGMGALPRGVSLGAFPRACERPRPPAPSLNAAMARLRACPLAYSASHMAWHVRARARPCACVAAHPACLACSLGSMVLQVLVVHSPRCCGRCTPLLRHSAL